MKELFGTVLPVVKPGGLIRLTEMETGLTTSSAIELLGEITSTAFHNAQAIVEMALEDYSVLIYARSVSVRKPEEHKAVR